MRKPDYLNPNAASRATQTFVSAPDGLLATRVLGDTVWQGTIERSEPVLCGTVIVPVRYYASAWLREALDDLSDVDAEAQESGYEPPFQQAKDHAERILRSLGHVGGGWPAPSVYPTSDGEVAILFRSESRQASVLILCASDGQGACFAFAEGRGRRARYEDAGELPDAFAHDQLRRLR